MLNAEWYAKYALKLDPNRGNLNLVNLATYNWTKWKRSDRNEYQEQIGGIPELDIKSLPNL